MNHLTQAQYTILATALKASVDPILAPLVAARDNVLIREYLNQPSTTSAWNENMTAKKLFDAQDITKYDSATITAGKRDAWQLFLMYAPHDFGTPKIRKVIEDVHGTADGVAILQACTRFATFGEVFLGGNVETRNTVSATDLNFEGTFSDGDVSKAFNDNP